MKETTMREREFSLRKTLQQKWLSRRDLVRAAGTVLGASLLRSNSVYASSDEEDREPRECVGVNPIPGGLAPFNPYGIFIHHNPLSPATPLAAISDPSQITDFDGFVGLTHIQGGGTGTDTTTGATMTLAFRADMGFSQGRFIGTDGHEHHGTLCFV
jgi:hypothetical protein